MAMAATLVETIYYILKLGTNTKDPSFEMDLGVRGWKKVEPARDGNGNPLVFRTEGEAEYYLFRHLSPEEGWFVQPYKHNFN